MIKILFRQIFKRWRGLLPVFIIWTVAGYLIFSDQHRFLNLFIPLDPGEQLSYPDKHTVFRKLAWILSGIPEPGSQDPETAYFDYILPAREILSENGTGFFCRMASFVGLCEVDSGIETVRLDLMAEACDRIPVGSVPMDSDFRPHWLEKIEKYDINPDSSVRQLVEPDEYWQENHEKVLTALRKAVQAMDYAYEIPTSVHQEAGSPTILVPEFVDRLASAVCRDEIGNLAWGDYVHFQEVRAFNRLEKEEVKDIEYRYLHPSEKDLLILNSLQESYEYIRALKEYSGSIVPDPWQPFGCGNEFLLACYAPEEARDIFNRLLYYSSRRERPSLYLKLGRIHLSLYRKYGSEHLDKALDYFTGASKSFDTEREARFSITRIYLKSGDYDRAHGQLIKLSQIMKNRGGEDREFRNLARLTLMGLGRFRDADCYADMSELSFGKRPHCEKPPY